MWEMILAILHWDQIVDTGVDAVVYFSIAAIATVLFVLRLALMLFIGDDGGDIDLADGDIADAAELDSGAAFNLFSLLSILAFLMGVGWMGLASRITWELGSTISLVVAVGSGAGMMFLAAGLMFFVRRLEHEAAYDVRSVVGRTGRVYLTIPADGKAGGQVEVTVSGRRKVLDARTRGGEIAAFTSVKVVDVSDDDTLIVETN